MVVDSVDAVVAVVVAVLVVLPDAVGDLHPDRGLAAALLAEDDGGAGPAGLAEDFLKIGVGAVIAHQARQSVILVKE